MFAKGIPTYINPQWDCWSYAWSHLDMGQNLVLFTDRTSVGPKVFFLMAVLQPPNTHIFLSGPTNSGIKRSSRSRKQKD
jgi:hypothetical protein